MGSKNFPNGNSWFGIKKLENGYQLCIVVVQPFSPSLSPPAGKLSNTSLLHLLCLQWWNYYYL